MQAWFKDNVWFAAIVAAAILWMNTAFPSNQQFVDFKREATARFDRDSQARATRDAELLRAIERLQDQVLEMRKELRK